MAAPVPASGAQRRTDDATDTAAAAPAPLIGRLALQTPLGAVLDDSRIRLLEAIDRCGSLNRAAREVPLSYKVAWDALDTMNRLAPQPLVVRSTGGAGGGGTRLTDFARQTVALYRAMESSQQDILDRLGQRLGEVPADADIATLRTLIRRLGMRSSARNQWPCRVVGLHDEGGSVQVELRLAPEETTDDGGTDAADATPGPRDIPVRGTVSLWATITPESVDGLELRPGRAVYALVKAPAVAIRGRAPRPQPGRNALPATVQALRASTTRTAVTLVLADGSPLHAAVPSAQAADLQPGRAVWAVFDGEQVTLLSFG